MVNAIKICSLGVCTHHGKNGLGICTQKVIAKEVDDVYRGDTARGVGKLQSLWVGINIDNVVCKTVWVGGIVEWGVEAENALYRVVGVDAGNATSSGGFGSLYPKQTAM